MSTFTFLVLKLSRSVCTDSVSNMATVNSRLQFFPFSLFSILDNNNKKIMVGGVCSLSDQC